MPKNSLIKKNILQYLEFKGITPYKFYQETGISRGVLSQNNGMSEENTSKFLAYYTEVDANMLLSDEKEFIANLTKPKKTTMSHDEKRIPLYNDVETIGGNNLLVASDTPANYTAEFISTGDFFPGATAAIRHYSDSMAEYPSGSILVLKEVQDKRLIFWGRNYCIETTEGRITKRLHKSETGNTLIGYSSNKETYPDGRIIHEPIDIPTETIRRIFQVLGCVIIEYGSGQVKLLDKK